MTKTGGGWTLASVPGFGFHCVPIDDLHEHMEEDCPCRPVRNECGLWEHNSFDGREAFETGERQPS